MTTLHFNGNYSWEASTSIVSSGTGGYCSVHSIQKKDNESIKGYVVKKTKRKNDNYLEKSIKEEIRILKELKDLDCVPKIEDNGNTSGYTWYVMEELKPVKLEDITSFSDAFSIIENISVSLMHIHEKNVAHRDIKLENILLRKDGSIVICDFGVSVSPKTDKTLLPFPIKIKRGINIPDELNKGELINSNESCISIFQKSDIYLFGFVILEILLKSRWEDSRKTLDVFSNEIKKIWNIDNESIFLYKLVKGCTEQQYDKRYSAQDIKSYIEKVKLCHKGIITDEMREEIVSIKKESFIASYSNNASSIYYSSDEQKDFIISYLNSFDYDGLLLEWDSMKLVLSSGRISENNVMELITKNNVILKFSVQELKLSPRKKSIVCEIYTGESDFDKSMSLDFFIQREGVIKKGNIVKICLQDHI